MSRADAILQSHRARCRAVGHTTESRPEHWLAEHIRQLCAELKQYEAPKPRDLDTQQVEAEIAGLLVVVEYQGEPEVPACGDDPGEDAHVELIAVWHRGADLLGVLDEQAYEAALDAAHKDMQPAVRRAAPMREVA